MISCLCVSSGQVLNNFRDQINTDLSALEKDVAALNDIEKKAEVILSFSEACVAVYTIYCWVFSFVHVYRHWILLLHIILATAYIVQQILFQINLALLHARQ